MKTHLSKTGKVVVSPKTENVLNKIVKGIDVRMKGTKGKTKKGKIIDNPQAYVWGGVRKSLSKINGGK